MQELIQLVEKLGSPRVLLAGDFILDSYVYGDVERINPEAPVPVLRTMRRQSSVGGAGNVAAAVPALGAQVRCVGVIGQDEAGGELSRLLNEAGAQTAPLLRVEGRPTAVKTRYVGLAQHRHPQQMLRVDEESTLPLSPAVQASIRGSFRTELSQADIVVLEDYNKGLLDDVLTPQLIADAARAGKIVVVDPALLNDFGRYRGAAVVKPNRYEAARASGIKIDSDASLAQAAAKLQKATDARAVVISLDRDGAYLFSDGAGKMIRHRCPRNVYDVTGAGDETLAVLAVALAGGCDYESAVELANMAGGLEVERFGFAPIRREELLGEMRRMMGLGGSKVVARTKLLEEVARRRQLGQTVVFTNGCFDLLHMGHVRYLQQARRQGHCLIVAVNSDASARRLKGPSRPVIGQDERAEMLGALDCVDYVTLFEEDTPEPLLRMLRPDVLVKGGATPTIVGREIVESYGGKVLSLELVAGLSTTAIIERIMGKNGQ